MVGYVSKKVVTHLKRAVVRAQLYGRSLLFERRAHREPPFLFSQNAIHHKVARRSKAITQSAILLHCVKPFEY
jgi:hypothetical protein